MNSVSLVGRLTRNPELRQTQSGKSVCAFTLAVNRRVSKNGNGNQSTDFIPIVTWGKLAETCAKFLEKGRLIGVVGKLRSRSYEVNGQRRFTIEVVANEIEFLGYKKNEEVTGSASEDNASEDNKVANDNGDWQTLPPLDDDDLPF